ncbi:MAG: protein YgfX [Gammaproteobacteria bacterium]
MNTRAEQAFEVRINLSKRLIKTMAAAHGLALIAASINALPAIFKLFLATAVAANFYFELKKATASRLFIRYSKASGWEIAENSEFESVSILNSTVLTRFAVWLHAETPRPSRLFGNARRLILIMSDALSEEDFRRLTVTLKTNAAD